MKQRQLAEVSGASTKQRDGRCQNTLHDIQYKTTKRTFPEFIFLILLCLLHVSNPRFRLQEDGCVYSYGMIRFTYIDISSQKMEECVRYITDTGIEHKLSSR